MMNDKTWKLWIYYLKPKYAEKYGSLPFCGSRTYELYAFTINSKYAKRFESERNMDYFYKKKVVVDKKELNDLYREYGTCDIREEDVKSKVSNEQVSICLTNYELTMITAAANHATMTQLWKYIQDANPIIFKKEYLEALKYIQYVNGYNMLHATNHTDVSKTWHYYGNIEPDLFTAFVSELSWSLKDMGMKEGD